MKEIQKKQLILDAAVTVFREKGFEKTRMDDVAQLAGIGKGTIYQYFSSKDELLLKSCSLCCQHIIESTQELKKELNQQQVNPAKAFYLIMVHLFKVMPQKMQEDLKLFTEGYRQVSPDPLLFQKFADSLEEVWLQWEEQFRVLIQSGVESGIFLENSNEKPWPHFLSLCMDGIAWQSRFRPNMAQEDFATQSSQFLLSLLLKFPSELQKVIS